MPDGKGGLAELGYWGGRSTKAGLSDWADRVEDSGFWDRSDIVDVNAETSLGFVGLVGRRRATWGVVEVDRLDEVVE